MIKVIENEAEAFVEQDWAAYTQDNHRAWNALFSRRMDHLQGVACSAFLEGAERIGLSPGQVPDLAVVNQRLQALTGWRAVPVAGFIHIKLFFRCLAERRFPTAVTIRPLDRLDYVPEPDIFHDVFGHVPLHADPLFSNLLQEFGAMGLAANSEKEMTALSRLFWFTVEFGLVREEGEVKVYGSGLISSHADCLNALGHGCERRPYSLDAVLAQDYDVHNIQPVLFVAESFAEVAESLTVTRRRLLSGELAPGA